MKHFDPTLELTLESYLKLCEEIWYHNRLYYHKTPEISDEAFDKMLTQLIAVEKIHPEWIHSSSPSQRVGEALTEGFKTIAHKIPMLSLPNTYEESEIEDFLTRVEKLSEKSDLSYSCELKMDGIAVTLFYEKGLFTKGITRGDGKKGDDITGNLKTLGNLPLQIYGVDVPEFLEIRGEVFMPHAEFERQNKEKIANQELPWANPRNAAAGSLKLLNPAETATRGLSVVCYQIAQDSSHNIKKQSEALNKIKSLGLPLLAMHRLCHDLNEIVKFASEVKEARRHFPFDIDGIVIKVDALNLQEKLGTTGKSPRWAVAYKFEAEKAIAKLLGISLQVGRTGTITPVAELEPTLLAGSRIARASLYNSEEIERKDIRIGDFVVIEKGGDVIPKVVEVDLSKRTDACLPWKMQELCPVCQTPLVKLEGEVAVKCPNNKGCPGQILERLVFFASKDAFDIDNLGVKVVEQLYQKGFVKKASDFFRLTAQDLIQLDGFKDKSIENLLQSLEKAKKPTLPRFIMGLQIKHVGLRTAQDLSDRTHSLDALSKLTEEELLHIEGIGATVALSILEFFKDDDNLIEIRKLLAAGIEPQNTKKIEGHVFEGKNFVITGSLVAFSRSEAATLIRDRGGKVSDSVSKKTHYLIIGADPGSKVDKAQKLGIEILSEDAFEQLLNLQNSN